MNDTLLEIIAEIEVSQKDCEYTDTYAYDIYQNCIDIIKKYIN